MLAYIWPIALVVLSNVFYQICSKSVPNNVNPFAALTLTYLVGAACTLIFFFTSKHDGNLIKEVAKMNWAPYVLGLVIVGLEVGYIYAYKAGWKVSVAATVQGSFLAVALIFVGALLFKETITWNKIVGIVLCLVGLFFINMK